MSEPSETARRKHSRMYREIARSIPSKELSAEKLKAREDYLLVCRFNSLVDNGGFSHFFTTEPAKDYRKVIEALKRIGAEKELSVLEHFLGEIPDNINHGDPEAMAAYLFGDGTPAKALDSINDKYFEGRENFYRKMIDFASSNCSE